MIFLPFSSRSERPLDWVPEEASSIKHESFGEDCFDYSQVSDNADNKIDIVFVHADNRTGNVDNLTWEVTQYSF